jgi:hypothetical protein
MGIGCGVYAAAMAMPSCSQQFATSDTVARCMSRFQRLRHWRHTLALLVAELGEAESGAGMEDRMLNNNGVGGFDLVAGEFSLLAGGSS